MATRSKSGSGRSKRRKSLLESRPRLEEQHVSYRPATATESEQLVVAHRWSGLVGGRHMVTFTYFGPPAEGQGQRTASRMDPNVQLIKKVFNLHADNARQVGTELDYSSRATKDLLVKDAPGGAVILNDAAEARDLFRKLAGHREYHCTTCQTILPMGGHYCVDEDCGAPVARSPQRSPATI